MLILLPLLMRITKALFASQEESEEGDVFQSKKLILTKFKLLSRPRVFYKSTKMIQQHRIHHASMRTRVQIPETT